MGIYYGLTEHGEIADKAISVCEVLGYGANGVASKFLCEIAAQETHSGRLMDRHTVSAGVGLMQIDRICFDDVRARTSNEIWDKVERNFGIIESTLSYEMLAYSPLLAMIFARLFLRLKPEEFPLEVEGRAEYWKKYYNTEAGAGTPGEYLENVEVYL
jgi:hypothetical protein